MSSDLENKIHLHRKIHAILKTLLTAKEWAVSFAVRASSKELRQCKEESETLLRQGEALLSHKESATNAFIRHEDNTMCYIYVCLYQARGSDLTRWESCLKSLPETNVGRAIYAQEAHAKQLIQFRRNPDNEGYVEVWVKRADILRLDDKTSVDESNHPLLLLQKGAIQSAGITQFVHANKKRYHWVQQKLVLQT